MKHSEFKYQVIIVTAMSVIASVFLTHVRVFVKIISIPDEELFSETAIWWTISSFV